MRAIGLVVVLLVLVPIVVSGVPDDPTGSTIPVEVRPARALPANVAVIMDQNPWGKTTTLDVLTAYAVPYDVYPSAVLDGLDLSSYDKVIISGDQDHFFYLAVDQSRTWLEMYMASGGCLLLCCSAPPASGIEPVRWPGFFTHFIAQPHLIDEVEILWPLHPVFNDPLPVEPEDLNAWSWSSYGSFQDTPGWEIARVENEQVVPGTPAAFDMSWPAGGAYVTAQPIEDMDNWQASGVNPYTVNVILYTCNALTPVESTTWGSIKALYRP